MKIIEAMKKIKDLTRKASDIKDKVSKNSADRDCENPTYPDQRRQISEWLQAYNDITKEILVLRFGVQKTNVMTQVTIEIGGKFVTKSITEWIHRRRDLAAMDESVWRALNDRGLVDEKFQLTPSSPVTIVKRRLYYDPVERDQKVELYRSEPSIIDATLETINAITDIVS